MILTQNFKDTIQKRIQEDSEFRICLLIGFEELANLTQKSSKSLMRMLSASGNPYAINLFEIIYCLQKKEGLTLKVSALK